MTNTLMGYDQNGQVISFHYADHQDDQLMIITSAIIRIFSDRGDQDYSYAIEGDKSQPTRFSVESDSHQISVITKDLIIEVSDDHHFDVFNGEHEPLILDYRGARQPLENDMDVEHLATVGAEGHVINELLPTNEHYWEVVKQLDASTNFYGLGDKTGFLNKRGYQFENWNSDIPDVHTEATPALYKSIPVLYGINHGRPFGLFFDNPFRSSFDLGKESNEYYFYATTGGNVNYYILGGKDLKEVVANYTYLTGKTPLPQKWTLGYQQSRWGYSTSAKRVEDIAKKFDDLKLPLDVIHLDIDYMRGYRDFTWDQDKYPDLSGFLSRMQKRQIRLMPIIDAGVKQDSDYDLYQVGEANHYFVTNRYGETYVNRVWPGDAVFPDFGKTTVQKWWAQNIKFLTDRGVCGVWNDMNEPASFNGPLPNDLIFTDHDQPSTHAKMHNVYGHNMSKATYQGLKELTGKRPFVITRAAYAGTQKYSTVWTGDNQSLWAHLQMVVPQLSNLGLSGFAFCGTDVGGFQADTTAELLIRWLEASLFVPLLRNHAQMGTRYQEPWVFGQPVLNLYRKYLQLRYRLIPFLYDQLRASSQSGLPVVRPLVLNYPDDPHVANLNDEYMVGDNVLVAPVVTQGSQERIVYFPSGCWHDFWSGQVYQGQTSQIIDAPLDHLPIFVRDNQILPLTQPALRVSQLSDQTITFKLFGQKGLYQHYQDNGEDFQYLQGAYNEYIVKVTDNHEITVTMNHHGYTPVYQTIKLETAWGNFELEYDRESNCYQ